MASATPKHLNVTLTLRCVLAILLGSILLIALASATPTRAYADIVHDGTKAYIRDQIGQAEEVENGLHVVKATNGAKVYNLEENTTYTQYDATGDGKPDKIRISTAYGNYDMGKKVSVYINGKRAFGERAAFWGIDAILIQLKNGRCFLYMYAPFENGDADICAVYKIKSSKLKKVIDCNKGLSRKAGYHFGGVVEKVSGNSIMMRFRIMSFMTGHTTADFSYKYKSGTLKRTSNIGKTKVGFYSGKYKNTYKAKMSIIAYKNASCKSKKFTIVKGQKVKFLKLYSKGNAMSYQVRVKGKTGWIKVAYSSSSSLLHQNSNPPFKGLFLAG